jgi:hypothetical protein
MHFLFRIGFVIFSEASVLSGGKSETFPRSFTVAETFLFENLVVSYLVQNFSRLIKKNNKYRIRFYSWGEVRLCLLRLCQHTYQYSILRMMAE